MPNQLIHEQSAYLLQHAHNPVNWYPWGDEAFAIAKERNMPVLVSIGYAACHWCHVMERESFEDENTAAYMNGHFVCIKVDREEHPDVDQMYMDAVQVINGSGGWPLNVFVTPNRQPFFGGTYYPVRPTYGRPTWMQVCMRMIDLWQNHHGEIRDQTKQLTEYLQQMATNLFPKASQVADMTSCRAMANDLLKQGDHLLGGFGNAPKFPATMAISYLLEHYHFTGYEPALRHALLSLDAMANGGIYDQLGGGFARYCTDSEWLAPHFEKMLYDNALLINAYCDAYLITGKERYREIIQDTIAFAERELKHPSGGYYCALDADSEGEEGKFYTWTWQEWQAVLGDNPIAAAYFGVEDVGNWHNTNILHVAKPLHEVAVAFGITDADVVGIINDVKQRLLTERNIKIRPITDDKCLLAWNALMNMALCKAGITLEKQEYIDSAVANMKWMCDTYYNDGVVTHTWKNGIARIPAKLDDMAYLVQAMLQLASAAGNEEWILKAAGLMDKVMAEFNHEEDYFYYTPVSQQDIPVRKVDLYDGATPSANSIMVYNLWICGLLLDKIVWVERAEKMLHNMCNTALKNTYSYANWAMLIQRNIHGIKTVICTGKNNALDFKEMKRIFVPQAYVVSCEKEKSEIPLLENKNFDGKKYIFVCSKNACYSPVTTIEDALVYINQQVI